MRFRRETRSAGFIFLVLLIAIIIGGYIGELLALILPEGGVKTFFLRSVEFGFETITINLAIIKFSFGLILRFNFASLLALAVVVYYFRWWF